MTNNTIKHLGIVEKIQGSHLSVRIVQTSACAACCLLYTSPYPVAGRGNPGRHWAGG